MRPNFSALLLLAASAPWTPHLAAQRTGNVGVWLTSQDRSRLLAQGPATIELHPRGTEAATITVDDKKRYQTIDGFGFALTGGSAQLLMKMGSGDRHALLQQIFGRGPNDAGVSYLRVSIGSSDMNDHVFTYDDRPEGQADPSLAHFALGEDEKDVVPVLREILGITPDLQILASPWTAPSWMKTNALPKGGNLRPEFYSAYAAYLVRYLQAMRGHGIAIAAVTMQNEPLNPKNTPSMVMEATEQQTFLRDAFGPALRKVNLHTRVILFDHNCNHPDYPLTVLSDPKARAYADGSGFHLYEGDITALSQVHDAVPDKNLYFTEQMVVEHTRDGVLEPVAVPVSRIVIGAMRNWSRTVLLWNLAADPGFGPHTNEGGCPVCQGAITLDGNTVSRNIAFYTVAQVSKFVPPGSVRIDSTEPDPELANVAWITPQGHVLLVTNTSTQQKKFKVAVGQQEFSAELEPGSVATYVWQ